MPLVSQDDQLKSDNISAAPVHQHHHPASLLIFKVNPTSKRNIGYHDTLRPMQDFRTYLDTQLATPKLQRIHSRLWLAGLPRPARPLHRQRLLQRTINITENPNEHLVWKEDQIYLKPLPSWLLDHAFWEAHLCNPSDSHAPTTTTTTANEKTVALHRSACGFLLSWTWLISYESDLALAHAHHLLPPHVTWPAWVNFTNRFLDGLAAADVDPRYHYGELRLPRLSLIYWLTPSAATLHDLVFGYMPRSTWYKDFFARNFAWLAVVFVYMTVVLSAMQVGLATEALARDRAFQRACFGVAVASMVAVAGMVGAIAVVWAGLFVFHLLATVEYKNRAEKARGVRRQGVAGGRRTGTAVVMVDAESG
ncbi:hypothetical protein B0J12DRAFT_743627 [Macrophomina phaseolina]|uniref:PRA1 family protein n=1 Tax=Macrophomina phaseolina TaxID=35725 RepID=A0ABQ8G3B2_9PEZI|nr:hypothetical protein B0J12DRAFT_743627 [Macrophomina phaseolina]